MENDGSLSKFSDAANAASVTPLWETFRDGMPTEPSSMQPFVWSWDTLNPLTQRAADEVPMEHVERRVLTLRNPFIEGSGSITLVNLVGALQTLLPGETAPLHRHSGNALRFVMDGEGAETIVDGKHCIMNERDLIITPVWSWHGHTHGGKERIVWFDALDIPLFRHMNAGFFEGGPPPNLPKKLPDNAFVNGGFMPEQSDNTSSYSPMFRYSWDGVLSALQQLPKETDGSRKIRYVNPQTGAAVMSLIDCFVLAMEKGQKTKPYRTTSSAICVVAEGEGKSDVGDYSIEWKKNDIFTLPNWNSISHLSQADDTKLFMVTDREVLNRLGMLRDEFV